jgi:peroxiredoxin
MKMKERLTLKLALLAVLIALFAGQGARARTAPDFSLPGADGKPVRLSNYRGKYVVVEIMLTTCPHCQTAGKVLERLYKEQSSQLMVIAVSTDFMSGSGLMLLDMYSKVHGITYPVVMGDWKVLNQYWGLLPGQNFHVPSFIFIDPSGEIVEDRNPDRASDNDWNANRDQNLEATVKKMLPPEKPAAKSRKTGGPAKKGAAANKQP